MQGKYNEIRDVVLFVLDKLPQPHRAIVNFVYGDGESIKEVAKELNTSSTYIKKILKQSDVMIEMAMQEYQDKYDVNLERMTHR